MAIDTPPRQIRPASIYERVSLQEGNEPLVADVLIDPKALLRFIETNR